MDPQNPYQAYSQLPNNSLGNTGVISRSILTQVRVIAILLIVHGIMLMLVGILYVGIAFVMPSLLAAQNNQFQPQPGGPSPEQMKSILLVTYGLMGAAGFVPGILQLIAGIANLRLKGRVLGIVALISGLISVGTCYCAPTGIALGVYGLVIYFNESASKAFALGAEGKTFSEVEQYTS